MPFIPSDQAVLVVPALIGDDAGALMPATWEVALFTGDPRGVGTELATVGGYARASLSNASAAWTGIGVGNALSEPVTYVVTGAWFDEATYAGLIDPANPTVVFAPQQLSEAVIVESVDDPAPVIRVRVTDAAAGVS